MTDINEIIAIPTSFFNLFMKIIGKLLMFNTRECSGTILFINDCNGFNSMKDCFLISDGLIVWKR